MRVDTSHLLNGLLPGPTRLRLTTLTASDQRIILALVATETAAPCPTCLCDSTRIHSYYQRTVADLPWAGLPVQLHLHLRRFMCDNPACPRVTFAEPLPEVVARSARRTTRLADMLADAAPATGARQTPSVVETKAASPTEPEASRPLPASGIPRPPYLERLQHQLRAKRKQRYDQVALRDAQFGLRSFDELLVVDWW